MGRRKKNEENNFVWTTLAGIPQKMKWPGKVVRSDNRRLVVYCKSDNASFLVKSEAVCPFPGQLTHWRDTGMTALKNLPKSRSDFLEDISWALKHVNGESPGESSSNDSQKEKPDDVISETPRDCISNDSQIEKPEHVVSETSVECSSNDNQIENLEYVISETLRGCSSNDNQIKRTENVLSETLRECSSNDNQIEKPEVVLGVTPRECSNDSQKENREHVTSETPQECSSNDNLIEKPEVVLNETPRECCSNNNRTEKPEHEISETPIECSSNDNQIEKPEHVLGEIPGECSSNDNQIEKPEHVISETPLECSSNDNQIEKPEHVISETPIECSSNDNQIEKPEHVISETPVECSSNDSQKEIPEHVISETPRECSSNDNQIEKPEYVLSETPVECSSNDSQKENPEHVISETPVECSSNDNQIKEPEHVISETPVECSSNDNQIEKPEHVISETPVECSSNDNQIEKPEHVISETPIECSSNDNQIEKPEHVISETPVECSSNDSQKEIPEHVISETPRECSSNDNQIEKPEYVLSETPVECSSNDSQKENPEHVISETPVECSSNDNQIEKPEHVLSETPGECSSNDNQIENPEHVISETPIECSSNDNQIEKPEVVLNETPRECSSNNNQTEKPEHVISETPIECSSNDNQIEKPEHVLGEIPGECSSNNNRKDKPEHVISETSVECSSNDNQIEKPEHVLSETPVECSSNDNQIEKPEHVISETPVECSSNDNQIKEPEHVISETPVECSSNDSQIEKPEHVISETSIECSSNDNQIKEPEHVISETPVECSSNDSQIENPEHVISETPVECSSNDNQIEKPEHVLSETPVECSSNDNQIENPEHVISETPVECSSNDNQIEKPEYVISETPVECSSNDNQIEKPEYVISETPVECSSNDNQIKEPDHVNAKYECEPIKNLGVVNNQDQVMQSYNLKDVMQLSDSDSTIIIEKMENGNFNIYEVRNGSAGSHSQMNLCSLAVEPDLNVKKEFQPLQLVERLQKNDECRKRNVEESSVPAKKAKLKNKVTGQVGEGRKRIWKRIRCPDDSDMEGDDSPNDSIDGEEPVIVKKSKLAEEVFNDSECSELYPLLSKLHTIDDKLPASESEIEEDEDEEQMNEEFIIRDEKHKDIYITAVVKDELSKRGKMKKNDRCYNSHHPCPFCGIFQTNFSHHVLSDKHSEETDVEEILRLDYSKCIDAEEKANIRKQRKILLDRLRRKGIHGHNLKVQKDKKGEIILERRLKKSDSFDIQKYGACPSCYGWMLTANLDRHQATCCTKTDIRQTKGSLITQSQIITGRISEEASHSLVKEVFTIMTDDKVGKIAKNDRLIIALGNEWMLSNLGNRIMRKYYTSSVMRLSAKLLISLRDITGRSENSMDDFIAPGYYDKFVKAALICSKQDINDEEDLKSPSNSIKLGYDIKRMASAKLGMAIVSGDDLKKAQAENFLTLLNMSWRLKVSKLARLVLTERSFNCVKQLPLPEDLQKIVMFMITEIGKLKLNDVSYKTYRRAAVLALSRITLYNRRRCHEVQALYLDDYKKRKSGADEVAMQMSKELTEFEQGLLDTHEVVMTRGKGGKGVPVIIPNDVMHIMEYLANGDIRQKVGIPCSRYLFANSNAGVYRGYDAISAVKKEAGLKLPNLVKTSNMRKYMATMIQCLDITENQRQWVLDHLGHTFDIHRMHYRQTSDLIERVQISKLLLIQDFGMVNKFVGKKLDEIQLEDIVPNEKNSIDDDNDKDDTDTTEDVTFASIDDIDEDFIPDMPENELDVMEERIEKKKCKRTKALVSRQKWTEDDVQELEQLFSVNLKKHRCPRQAEIQKKIGISKTNGGHIHKRKVDNIKKKVSNMIQKLKKK